MLLKKYFLKQEIDGCDIMAINFFFFLKVLCNSDGGKDKGYYYNNDESAL